MPLLSFLAWVGFGELVGFIIIFICYPTQHNLVNRKHPSMKILSYEFSELSVLFSVDHLRLNLSDFIQVHSFNGVAEVCTGSWAGLP